MYKYIGILVGLLVLLMVFIWLTNLLNEDSSLTYSEIESKLVFAAKSYVEDHPAMYPTEVGTSNTISSSVLISNGYMDEFSSYVPDSGVVCTGSVDVYLSSEDVYHFVPDFNCGNQYNTIRLYDKVLLDNGYGVTSGYGLYERVDGEFVLEEHSDNLDNYQTLEYVFRGAEVNNFVQIDENIWRIVAITEDNEMLMIYNGNVQKASAWDDRYNEDVDKEQGINTYEENGIKSSIMQTLESFYAGELTLVNKEEYSSKTRYLTSPMTLCVGKRSTTDTDMSGRTECAVTLENQNVGLLPAYYYMSASLDSSCKSINSKSCGNVNWLSDFDDHWWLLTANSENTNESYYVSRNRIESYLCSAKYTVRPTIMLGSRVVYESGTGSEADPYTIRFYE